MIVFVHVYKCVKLKNSAVLGDMILLPYQEETVRSCT